MRNGKTGLRVAIVHDWLVVSAGAERVLAEMLAVYPEADVYSLIDFLPEGDRGFLAGRRVHTSFLQHIPFVRHKYRSYLPLMPCAVRQFDLTGYDVVISSSHAVANGVRTNDRQLHVSMCYSPMRWAWDLEGLYLSQMGLDRGPKGLVTRCLLKWLRAWDRRTAQDVDTFLAISQHVARRIRDCYGRVSEVVYPPVAVDRFRVIASKDNFYLTVSRLVPYKRVDLIVQAFTAMPDRRLVVIGDGPMAQRIGAEAGSNVTLLGRQPESVVRDYLERARAFVFAATEDFGIAPLEAQACGTPVIARACGALTETIRGIDHPEPTGILYDAPTVEDLCAAVTRFERDGHRLLPEACRLNAERFASGRFRTAFADAVRRAWRCYRLSRGTS